MQADTDKINTFLHYGYFPNAKVILPDSLQNWLDSDDQPDFNGANEADLLIKGANALRRSFKSTISGDHNKTHVVPLSGGLDSRTILANLLEQIDPSGIITVTFGRPGSPDYERARSIARKADVKWEGIDLSPGKWKWDTEILVKTSKRCISPTFLFDSCVNHAIQLRYGKDPVYWSGFMGDSLGCLEPISSKVNTWEEAKAAFVHKNCITRNAKITIDGYAPVDCLPLNPLVHQEKLDYYSQLNHLIRQQCLTKHIYSPVGYDVRYPFLNHEWVDFILNVPVQFNYRQVLYRKIQRSYWPHLFTSWNSPFRDSTIWETLMHNRRRNLLSRFVRKNLAVAGINLGADNAVKYIDWNHAILYQMDFKNVVYSNIMDLKTRNIIDWIDLEFLWTQNSHTRKNLAFELMTLSALELHIKANSIAV
jgi:hypothetical protein